MAALQRRVVHIQRSQIGVLVNLAGVAYFAFQNQRFFARCAPRAENT